MNTYYRRLGPLEDAPSNAIRVKRVDVELPVVFTLVPADIENTPDSASTGKDEIDPVIGYRYDQEIPKPICEMQQITPSGGGEWTDETVKAIFDAFWPGPFFKQVAVAYNAALRENNEKWRKEVKQFIERQHSLRDCGNDTKRLDLMEKQGGQFAKIKGKSWRESADIHAAMLETGDQTKEKELPSKKFDKRGDGVP